MPRNPSNFYDQTLTVQRATSAKDASGSNIDAYATVYENVPASVQPQDGTDAAFAGRPARYPAYNVYCSTAYTIELYDWLVWGTRTLQVVQPARN